MNTAHSGSTGHQHSGKSHLLRMVWLAAGILTVLLLTGRPLGNAVFLSILLACPLMMVTMMFTMSRGQRQDDDSSKVTDRQ